MLRKFFLQLSYHTSMKVLGMFAAKVDINRIIEINDLTFNQLFDIRFYSSVISISSSC
jgi:hypothetical protein